MNTMEYMLTICSERARLDGHDMLADDLAKLAAASTCYQDTGDQGEIYLTKMKQRFEEWYAALLHSDDARNRYAARRKEGRALHDRTSSGRATSPTRRECSTQT
jgi:hypothetical protein